MAATAGLSGVNTPDDRSPPRNSVANPPRCRARARISSAGCFERSQRSAPPHSIICSPSSSSGAAVEGVDTLQSGAAPAKKSSVCSRTPRQNCAASAGSIDSPPSAARPACVAATAPDSRTESSAAAPYRCRDRQRLPCPALSFVEAAASLISKHSVVSAIGDGKHFQRHLDDDAENAERSRERARDVVARDVLHDGAAERQDSTLSIEQLRAKHEIAHAAAGRADEARRGPARPAAMHPPTVAPAAEMRRLEGQHLAVRGEFVFELSQRRARTRSDHEFSGFVGDDAAYRGRIEDLAARRVAVEILGAAGANAERRAVWTPQRALARSALSSAIVHQNRGSSANLRSPARTRIRPYSAQR